jgi:hypothetical protein
MVPYISTVTSEYASLGFGMLLSSVDDIISLCRLYSWPSPFRNSVTYKTPELITHNHHCDKA